MLYIAAAFRRVVDRSGVAGCSAQDFSRLIQRYAAASGDIEDLAGYLFGGRFRGQQIAVDDIRNEGKVAALFSIAVNGGNIARHHLLGKDSQDAGVLRSGVLPGAEYIEVAQSHSLQSINSGEGLHVEFPSQLRCCVRGDRIGLHLLGLRQRGGIAVHRRGAGINHPSNLCIPCCNQQLNGSRHAGMVGRYRIFNGARYGGDCRFMKDALDAATCISHRRGIVDVGLDQFHRFKANQILALAGDKVVDAANLLSPRQ